MSKLFKLINKWEEVAFESSSQTTKEFTDFAREFKAVIKEQVSPDFTIVGYSRGHFEVSAFLQHKESGRFLYVHISDVRHFPGEWYKHVLIRTAKDEKDYSGGHNQYTLLTQLGEKAKSIMEWEMRHGS